MCSRLVLFVVLLYIVPMTLQESCTLDNNKRGVCKHLTQCPIALQQLKNQRNPKICSFDGLQPIVCCEEDPNFIRKSVQKCKEYSNLRLEIEADEEPLVTGGKNAVPKEFPHMALLGFGDQTDIQWKCGGSLISERFILTAGHCLYTAEHGDVKYARLGDLDIYTDADEASPQEFTINKIIPHPSYEEDSNYNDIALLKLDRSVRFTDFVRPACLHNDYNIPNTTLKATGWGALNYGGDNHSFLQKVNLWRYSKKICDRSYKPQLGLRNGVQDDLQICAGSYNGGDTCQGDSGGPLQRVIQSNPLMYSIVGIVSVGKQCAVVPALYTRVSTYITWIEDEVWL